MSADLTDRLHVYYDALLERAGPANAFVLREGLAAMQAIARAAHPLEVGQIAPDFSLPDQDGTLVALGERLAQGPLALVFYRGGWSPLCEITLRAWEAARPGLRRLGCDWMAISPDLVATARATATANWITAPLLADPDNQVSAAFGVDYLMPASMRRIYQRFNHRVGKRCACWRVPLTATYLLGQDRRVLGAHWDGAPFARMDPGAAERVFAALGHGNQRAA